MSGIASSRGRARSRSREVDAAARRPRAPRGAAPARAWAARSNASSSRRRRARRCAAGVGHVAQPGVRAAAAEARAISRRWIASARSSSISCSVIAHASVSHGAGRRRTRSVRVRAHRAADHRVVAEALVERPQVVVDAGREAHPLDRRRGRRLGSPRGPRTARGRGAGWATADQHRLAVDVQQPHAARRRGGAAARPPSRGRGGTATAACTSTRSSTGASAQGDAQSRAQQVDVDQERVASRRSRRPRPSCACLRRGPLGAAAGARPRRSTAPADEAGGRQRGGLARRAASACVARLEHARVARRRPEGRRRPRPRLPGQLTVVLVSMTAQQDACGTPPRRARSGQRAEHAVPVRRADAEAALVVLEVVAHVQLPQPAPDARARRVVVHVVVDHVVGQVAGQEAGAERGRVRRRRARARRARRTTSASGTLAAGGMTSRSGSFGWSWWTPWIIQCSRAPMPVLGLEVEDDAVQPVLGERPDGVAAEHERRGSRRRRRARSPVSEQDGDDGREDQDRYGGVHAREAVQQRGLEHGRRGLQELLSAVHAATRYRSVLGRPQGPLVDAEAPHDAAVHRLHRAVHVLVGLEDPAHLAPRLRRRVRPCRSARRTAPAATPVCWNSGLTPRKPTRTRSIVLPLRRKYHQPSGSSRPFIFLSTWLMSGTVIATADRLALRRSRRP